jgi:solute carrier family 36 (proton-coupled amino acid transporter)
MLVVSCIITLYCAKLLLETRKKLGANSYTEIGEMTYGTWGRVSVDIALSLSQTGFCCAYIFFIKENFSTIAEEWLDYSISTNALAFGTFILFTLMCFVRKIEIFASTHAFADAMIVITMVTVVIYGSFYIKDNGT